jgi:hypothetical protein
VLIGNLGLSNEWTPGLLVFLLMLLGGGDNKAALCAYATSYGLMNPSKPGTLWPPLVQKWATGKTLVTENQVTLDLTTEPRAIGITSMLIFTLDDLGMTDNQCEFTATDVFVYIDALLAGGSIRVADNRFSESWMHSALSAWSIGLMNTTVDNQSTHCMRADARLPNMRVFKDNLVLLNAFCPDACSNTRG